MSETLSPLSQDEHELDKHIAEAGKELANQIPWEKTHKDLYDDTGALTTDGRIAQAAVNRVPNPDFRTEHENGLLNALNASRVRDTDVAQEAAHREKGYRDYARSLDKLADSPGHSELEVEAKYAALSEKRQKAYRSVSKIGRIARKLTGRPMPDELLTLDDVSDEDARLYVQNAAKETRQRAYKAGNEVIKSHEK